MGIDAAESYEIGPIRPPSEAHSLLIRVTRNCPWNRCLFCHTYKGMQFQVRPVEEVKRDIDTAKKIYDNIKALGEGNGFGDDMHKASALIMNGAPNDSYYNVALWQYAGGENVFLQDGNSLVIQTGRLVDILDYLKVTFPGIRRITSYARSETVARKTADELKRLHRAGISRLHIGLESGYDPLLQYIKKGVTAAEHIRAGKNVVASGISLCDYVLLGLGGKAMWHEHAIETAKVLNQINPDYIRVRTLTVIPGMPLYDEVTNGSFTRLNGIELAQEEKLLIENLDCSSNFISDHSTNLFQEINGKLPEDKSKFLAIINRFLALSPAEKLNFDIGRRAGVYYRLDNMQDKAKHRMVEEYIARYVQDRNEADKVVWRLMEGFI